MESLLPLPESCAATTLMYQVVQYLVYRYSTLFITTRTTAAPNWSLTLTKHAMIMFLGNWPSFSCQKSSFRKFARVLSECREAKEKLISTSSMWKLHQSRRSLGKIVKYPCLCLPCLPSASFLPILLEKAGAWLYYIKKWGNGKKGFGKDFPRRTGPISQEYLLKGSTQEWVTQQNILTSYWHISVPVACAK